MLGCQNRSPILQIFRFCLSESYDDLSQFSLVDQVTIIKY